jgi:cellulose synthase/poly-beta-1,6-N-acetylglucosamine synthase-like glycosyltransferase
MPTLLTAIYTLGFVILSLYGIKALLLTAAYLRLGRRPEVGEPIDEHPFVTVQLPLYNERAVACRAIDAVCRLRWPRDRFEVQVMDDSTDETGAIVDATVDAWRARGVDVVVLHRANRRGYKGGALAEGTRAARGELMAVFDADFVPAPDFLQRTVPHMRPGVAAVQARWGHLNADSSRLTRAQALALDGHFIIEQTSRSRLGLFLNFNGTAGIWRRAAIEDAGGWQGDTLSEDVDLSYRAQLNGWRIVFLPDVEVPSELPTTHLAFKRQQKRWAKGTTQVFLKLGREVWGADRPLAVRLHALLSLTGHVTHPIMLGLFLFAPLLLVHKPSFHPALGILTLVAVCPPLMYAVALARLYPDWPRRLAVYPLLAVLAMGMTLNGTVAVTEAWLGRHGAFERTPKTGDRGGQTDEGPAAAGYQLPVDRIVVVEALLAAYAWFGLAEALQRHATGLVMFMALFAVGYSLTAWLSLENAGRETLTALGAEVGEP